MTPAVTTWMLLFVLHDPHGNLRQERIVNFLSQQHCERVGNALNASITWRCEKAPPLGCLTS